MKPICSVVFGWMNRPFRNSAGKWGEFSNFNQSIPAFSYDLKKAEMKITYVCSEYHGILKYK